MAVFDLAEVDGLCDEEVIEQARKYRIK